MSQLLMNESYEKFLNELDRVIVRHHKAAGDFNRSSADILTAFLHVMTGLIVDLDIKDREKLITLFAATLLANSEHATESEAMKCNVPAND